MLIRFSVENFLSFKELSQLSMIPGKGSSLAHHVRRENKRGDFSCLKSALIYGPNASGKSNLVKAMRFAQLMVEQVARKGHVIPVTPFRLDAETRDKPSRFEFEFKANETSYAYGFLLNRESILEEWLCEIHKSTEKTLFERITKADGSVEVKMPGLTLPNKETKSRLQFMAEDTLPNELFLSSVNKRNLSEISGIASLVSTYTWITSSLKIIFPDSRLEGVEVELASDQEFLEVFNRLLHYFNTGIVGIATKTINFDSSGVRLPEQVKAAIKDRLLPGERVIFSDLDGIRYTLRRDDEGKLFAVKVMTRHHVAHREEDELFEMNEESDGTQRIMDLIPMLADLQKEPAVYVIDELDRSLHPGLTHRMLELFHSYESPTQGQLIVTTHESGLLDLELLRKDEIWFVEKTQEGSSTLFSLEEFKPRKDKEIRKGYLQGRYGAIPVFGPKKSLLDVLTAD
ncbi:MAG: ATP-binding protein [Bacteroidia bacterium]|nr:ATP-binding protein [Bacteroidia bacterium]